MKHVFKLNSIIFSFSLILTFNGFLGAQAPSIPWVSQLQGTYGANVVAMVNDPSGNLYTACTFAQKMSIGTQTIYGAGYQDVCILKTDPQGTLIWYKLIMGGTYQTASAMICDPQGNLYITGNFSGNSLFGSSVLVPVGGYDAYLAKLDTDGNFIWSQRMGGAGLDYGISLSYDSNSNLYASGTFEGSGTFKTTTLQASGKHDVFVMKTNPLDGSLIWVNKFGGPNEELPAYVTVEALGTIYVAGSFSTSTSIGTHNLTSSGGYDVFLTALEPSMGTVQWVERIGGTGDEWASAIATDKQGFVYTAGRFSGVVSYGNTSLICSGGSNVFCIKNQGSSGNPSFVKSFKEIGQWHSCNAMAYNGNDKIYLSGSFDGKIAIGSNTFTSLGGTDIFLAEMDTSGNILWADRKGGIGQDVGRTVCIDFVNNIYTGGSFSETFPFGNTTLSLPGENGGYIARWGTTPLTGVYTLSSNNVSNATFLLYPNPAKNNLHLKFNTLQESNIRISNVLGQTLLERRTNTPTEVIALTDWPVGVYFVTTFDQTGNAHTQKFLKE